MRIMALAIKDFVQIVKDWKAAVFLLISPIVFTLFFGYVFSGEGEADSRLPVGYLDLDGESQSSSLLGLIEQTGVVRLEAGAHRDELLYRLDKGELAAAIIIPNGFSAQLLSGAPMAVTVLADLQGNAGYTVETAVNTALGRLGAAAQISQVGTEAYRGLDLTATEKTSLSFGQRVFVSAISAWVNPPAKVVTRPATALEQAGEQHYNAYATSSPGMMAQFAIAGLIGAAEVLVKERKTRSLQRLLTTAARRSEILLGHFLAMFILIFLQFAVLIGFGQVFLGLNYAHDWLATALVAVSMCLCAAGMGLLIGIYSKSEEQVIILTLIPMFVLSALGGAWMPLEIMPPAVQLVGHVSPVAWMMQGFQDILLRGAGWQDVLIPSAVLLGFTALFSMLGGLKFLRSAE